MEKMKSVVEHSALSLFLPLPRSFVKLLVKSLLVIHCLLLPLLKGMAQTSPGERPRTVLVLGLKASQFYANVYAVDELAFINDSTGLTRENAKRVIDTYNGRLLDAFTNFSSAQYRFVPIEPQTAAGIHTRSNYVNWQNEFKESYTSLESDSVQDKALRDLMDAYQADYLLSVNFYEIISGYTPMYLSPFIRTNHQVDYEIFNRNLGIVTAGRVFLVSKDIRAASMQSQYQEFVRAVTERLAMVESSPDKATLRQKYLSLQEKRLKNVWGAGLALGWESPYGWAGVELFRNLGYKFDLGAGIGVAPNGFNAGIGLRHYLLGYGKRYKPFLSAHLGWASGRKVSMGGEEDEDGNQIAQEDISTYQIPAGAAVHLKTGFRWLSRHHSLLLGVGYALPFRPYKARWDEQTKESASRQRLANAYAVGGFEVSFSYLVYFSTLR